MVVEEEDQRHEPAAPILLELTCSGLSHGKLKFPLASPCLRCRPAAATLLTLKLGLTPPTTLELIPDRREFMV